MKRCLLSLLAIVCVLAILSCSDDGDDTPVPPVVDEPQFGAVAGIVTDADTGKPIPWATATLQAQTVGVEIDGRYVFTGIGYADALTLVIEAEDYEPQTQVFALNVDRLALDVTLEPLVQPEIGIQQTLDSLSTLISSRDLRNLEAIEAHFSEEYAAADDPVTRFALVAGVIPANFEKVVPAITTLFEEFDAIQFLFNEVRIEAVHARQATAWLNLEVITETGPRPDRKEVVADCRIDFRKENGDWKAIYWQLFKVDVRL